MLVFQQSKTKVKTNVEKDGIFLQGFEISRAFLRAKLVRKYRGNFQISVEIMHVKIVLIRFPSSKDLI